MSSGDLDFDDVLELALGNEKPQGITDREASMINDRLNLRITTVRLASLTVGLDPAGIQTRNQHHSLKHSVLYVALGNDGHARFSMENSAQSKKGTAAKGELIMKFQDFKGSSWKEVMSIARPWKAQRWVPTLRHLILLISVGGMENFQMAPDLVGCRRWVQGVSTVLIDNICFDLNTAHKELGWDDMSPRKGLKPEELDQELARLSHTRNDHYFRYYYTLRGAMREMAPPEGDFAGVAEAGWRIGVDS